jgi:hypothetical protein
MPRDAITTLDQLPLFAPDEAIGEAVLGRDRGCEFHGLASLHERHGMPKICTEWGGRYVPAVRAYFDHVYGLSAAVPLAPDGVEGKFDDEKPRSRKRTGGEVAAPPNRPVRPLLVR